MDRGAEYAQSEQSSAATYSTQDPRSATLSSSTTPISDYSHGPTSSSARVSSYSQDHIARYPQYSQPPHQHGSLVAMAQQPNPSISQASPTYPPYSPYAPGPGPDGMQYAQHQAPQYDYNRGAPGPQPGPWTGYPSHQQMPGQYHHPSAVGQPPQTSAPRSGQVYSFVPIPGAQQHKRPRRRYEEIERMYKCGWNGCEKAYGTLNHLNAHVTMQSHGTKRTPEEFKEIRKEWKARKKEEENARKADEDRARAAAQQAAQAQQGVDGPPGDHPGQGQSYQQNGARPLPPPTLPPIGYGPGNEQQQGQYAQPNNMVYQQQSNGQMHYPPQGYPNSPYGQQGQVYQQQGQPSHY